MVKKAKYKILIVDDDEFLLDMYSLKFKESGFEIEIGFGGADALEKMKNGLEPDVILMDLVMPNMDGFELLTALKNEKLVENTVTVILTNLGQKEDMEKGLKIGADEYIIKAHHTPSEVVKKTIELLKKKKKKKSK